MAKYKSTYKRPKAKSSLPFWMIVGGVVMLLAAVLAVVFNANRSKAAIEVTGSPSIKVDQESFDYGEVLLGGTPIRTDVTVTNIGDQTLKFTEAPYIEVLEGC